MKKLLFISLFVGAFSLCITAQTPYSSTLDINNVEATVHANGYYFWDLQGSSLYFIPAGTSKSTLYMFNTWLAGFDASDSLHLATNSYEENDFLAGPIIDIANFNDLITAQEYNKIWKVYRSQIDEFKQEWLLGNVTNGSYTIPDVIASWPGNHPGMAERLAPYVDINLDGSYNPMDGDYPEIKGDAMLWWVYNDNATHECSQGAALGAEYRVSFYAFNYANPQNDSIAAINDITFLHIEVVNRSNHDYHATRFGLFADFDIGYAYDDYIGSHVGYNSFYGYNADDVDGFGMAGHYGGPTPPPPSQSITLLAGPKADELDGIDNDRDGTVDEPDELWGMSHFMKIYQGTNSGITSPQTPLAYYNYMQSIWPSNTHLVYGKYGYITDTTLTYTETNYAFPGASDPTGWGQNGQVMAPWYETDSVNPPDDIKGLGSCGPFTFEQGEMFSVDLALVFAQADTGSSFTSVEENFEIIEDVIAWFNKQDFPSSYSIGMNEPQEDVHFHLFPNPANDKIHLTLQQKIYPGTQIEMYNYEGRLVKLIMPTHQSFEIDLNQLPKGVYYLKCLGYQTIEVGKFVKL